MSLDIAQVVRFAVPFDLRVETCEAADPADLQARLTQMGTDGVEYAIVPHEPGVCAIFALDSVAEPRAGVADDGLPLPPPEMVRLVAGISTPYRFYQRFIKGGATGGTSRERGCTVRTTTRS